MISYYTSIIALCWLGLGALSVLVYDNDRIGRDEKRRLYLTYAIVAVSALAEWLGVQLNGNQGLPTWLLTTVKCTDYMLTPAAGAALVSQMRRNSPTQRALVAIIAANAIAQPIACAAGWMITIDQTHTYAHGPLYPAYMAVCLLVVALIIAEFVGYSRSFRRQNHASLYAIMVVVVAGIAIQELLGEEFRTAYIAITLAAALIFIHFVEFSQMASDDHILQQQIQITTDALTGTYSRHAYSLALGEHEDAKDLPRDFVVFSIDVNELKAVNDTLGHEAGDELICGAADCIGQVMGDAGKCYRTGGDEFVVIARMDKTQADDAIVRLTAKVASWKGELVDSLSLAAGYALATEHPGLSAEQLVKESDLAMYAAKAAYYRSTGKDRRRRSRD